MSKSKTTTTKKARTAKPDTTGMPPADPKIVAATTHVLTDGRREPHIEPGDLPPTLESPPQPDLEAAGEETIDVENFDDLDADARGAKIRQLSESIELLEASNAKNSKELAIIYFRLGCLLLQEKDIVPHGDWLDWLEDHHVGERRAQRAMQIAAHFKRESEVVGLFVSKALAQSRPPDARKRSKRGELVSGLESINRKLAKYALDIDKMTANREPLLGKINSIASHIERLRRLCAVEPVKK
jgi:hypothetical protein